MRCQTFFFFFASSADHEQRDWSPCKVVFRVGNQYAECEKQHINMKQYTLVPWYIFTILFDDVLLCFSFVFAFCLVSLHGE